MYHCYWLDAVFRNCWEIEYKYDDHQVEIREADTNLLIWRAWDFEPDFEYNFKQQLQRFIKN